MSDAATHEQLVRGDPSLSDMIKYEANHLICHDCTGQFPPESELASRPSDMRTTGGRTLDPLMFGGRVASLVEAVRWNIDDSSTTKVTTCPLNIIMSAEQY